MTNPQHDMIFYVEGADASKNLPGWYKGPAIFKNPKLGENDNFINIDFDDWISQNTSKKFALVSITNVPIRHGKNGLFKFDNKDIYYGDWKDGFRSGSGKHTYNTKCTYEGQWNNDQWTCGTFTHPDGSTYTGNFVNGWAHCKNGKYIKRNNNVVEYTYIGNWVNDKRNGKGIITYSNGDVFDGCWKNDKIENGIMKYSNNSSYEGEWLENKRHGKGILTYPNGNILNGQWDNNKIIYGIMTFMNGNVYNGNFKNDKNDVNDQNDVNNQNDQNFIQFDYGTMEYSNGNKYTGHWNNNLKHNLGTMIYSDGNVFTGNWLNDSMKDGKLLFANKDYCEGTWENNIMIGKIKVRKTYPNEGIYEGEIENDKRNGYGIMNYNDTRIYVGYWVNDNRHGEGTMTYKNGDKYEDKYEGEWNNNTFQFSKVIIKRERDSTEILEIPNKKLAVENNQELIEDSGIIDISSS